MNTGTATGDYEGQTYSDTDRAKYYGYSGAVPSIDIEKYVSVDDQATWHDADALPGPEVLAGSETVWFRFVVTNDGDVALTDVTLSDSDFDAEIASQCTVPDELAPGESFECLIGPFVAIEGQHVNTGTATGDYDGETYSDEDDANYFGTVPEPPEPTELILEPDEATNVLPQNTSHEFTATVLDQYGDPMEGVLVSFSTDFGHFEGDGQYVEVLTNASGQATVTVVSTTAGTAHIRAWVDDDGNDTYAEGELSDDPSTKTWEGEGPTSLVVEKTAEALWARVYDWSISKSVEPDALELAQGESGVVNYTIEVERQVAGDTYTVQGTIYAENDIENTAHLVDVVDCIEYRDPGNLGPEPGGFTTLTCEPLQTGGTIAPGATETWGYSIEFTPVSGANAYRNRAEVTISNHPDGEHTFLYRKDFDLPAEPTSEEDACATVTDEQVIPTGFSAT
ncbi:MAG: Ig-like domain-containing protein, partial [Anaerolineae bacterium]|nr:Ig-like domain-containing protein [Anaerolineae bacterium]